MTDVEALSDAELRDQLKKHGIDVGPVTGTTRGIYEKKLATVLKGGKAKPKSTPARKPAAEPKSTRKTTATRASTSRRLERSETEEESDDEVRVVSPRPQSAKIPTAKPVASTPVPRKIPSRAPRTPSPVAAPTITLDSTPPRPALDHSPRIYASVDKPGSTPPRVLKTPRSTRTTTTLTSSIISPSPSVQKSYARSHNESFDKFPSIAQARKILDLGNTTGEEDDSDGGMETSRVVHNINEGKHDKRSPLRKAWDTLLGNDFKAGKVPGTSYEMRHGSMKTRVDRDPKTGRLRVKQQNVGSDISTILVIILGLFGIVLSLLYFVSARPEAVSGTMHAVKGAFQDTINFIYNYAVLPVVVVALATVTVVLVYFGQKYYRDMQKKEQEEFEELVEKIIEKVHSSSEEGEYYISVPHVRDVMFPPARRSKSELARWQRAVDFINENESRIATETRYIRGQECAVWRWMPAKKTGWQGSAFSPTLRTTPSNVAAQNVPIEALTSSLKIRGVFEYRENKEEDEEVDYDELERAIRDRLFPIQPVHMSFDQQSPEGILYMKLASKSDAKAAFSALHAIWFNGRLVSVKYIRDSRYFERFPEAARLA